MKAFSLGLALLLPGASCSSAKTSPFESTPPLRVIQYAESGAAFDAADRRAILDGESVLKRFYEGYGVRVVFEPGVLEFHGRRLAFSPGGSVKAYWTVHDELKVA